MRMYSIAEIFEYMWKVENSQRVDSKPIDDLTKETE